MTRNGKIARLPWALREELNRRLRDGEPGKNLVDWLNNLPAVQEVLRKEFGGQLISEQNLSGWKQGGFEEWLRHQETRTWVGELASQAADIREEAEELSVADLLAVPLAVALGRQLHSLAAKATADPKQVKELLDLARELTRLRRHDYSQKCLSFQRERWEMELKLKLQTLLSKGPFRQTLLEMHWAAIKKRYVEKKKRGSLSAEEEAHYKEALAKIARWQCNPREGMANEYLLVAAAGSQDPERFL